MSTDWEPFQIVREILYCWAKKWCNLVFPSATYVGNNFCLVRMGKGLWLVMTVITRFVSHVSNMKSMRDIVSAWTVPLPIKVIFSCAHYTRLIHVYFCWICYVKVCFCLYFYVGRTKDDDDDHDDVNDGGDVIEVHVNPSTVASQINNSEVVSYYELLHDKEHP